MICANLWIVFNHFCAGVFPNHLRHRIFVQKANLAKNSFEKQEKAHNFFFLSKLTTYGLSKPQVSNLKIPTKMKVSGPISNQRTAFQLAAFLWSKRSQRPKFIPALYWDTNLKIKIPYFSENINFTLNQANKSCVKVESSYECST